MIDVIKQMVEALEWCHGGEPVGTADAIQAGKQLIAELESQEPVVTVPRRLALNTWAFLAQDCSPCAHEECQIGLKNVGVDTLTEAWNKQLAGNTHPQQRKPLTDEQIETIRQQPQHHKGEFDYEFDYEFDELSFARAIEAAHGIKE